MASSFRNQILEECLKELVAITVVRLSSGVDTLSYA